MVKFGRDIPGIPATGRDFHVDRLSKEIIAPEWCNDYMIPPQTPRFEELKKTWVELCNKSEEFKRFADVKLFVARI